MASNSSVLTKKVMNIPPGRFAAIDLGLCIIPINTIEEGAQLLKQMVNCEDKKQNNPFRIRPSLASSPDEDILKTLETIPGFGGKRALLVMEKFGTLEKVINATEKQLAEAVGASASVSAYKFLHQNF